MTDRHKAAMAAGRRRAAERRHHEALERVQAFKAYLRVSRRLPDGTWPRVSMPRIPTDAEWTQAREAGVVS